MHSRLDYRITDWRLYLERGVRQADPISADTVCSVLISHEYTRTSIDDIGALGRVQKNMGLLMSRDTQKYLINKTK